MRDFEALHFQYARSQFVYSIFYVFRQVAKDELAVLQQRAVARITDETRITYDTLLCTGGL